MNQMSDELREVRKTLAEADTTAIDSVRVDRFKRGMEALLDFIEECEPEEQQIAENMVDTYLKRLIFHMGAYVNSGREVNPEIYGQYLWLLLKYIGKCDTIIEKRIDLKQARDSFLALYKDDIIKALEELD